MEKIFKKKIHVEPEEKSAILYPFYDIHHGNANHDVKSFNRFIKPVIKDPNSYVIGGGDWIEGAIYGSAGREDQVVEIDDQIDYIVGKFRPIAEEGRLFGILRGNHEARSRRSGNVDHARRIAKDLEVPYFRGGIFLSITILLGNNSRGKTYTGYAIHGKSGARTPEGKMRSCKKLAEVAEVDLYLMGHVHALISAKGFKYAVKSGHIQDITPTFVLCGHYLEYIGSYAQEWGIQPSGPAGTPKIKLHGDMKRISVVI